MESDPRTSYAPALRSRIPDLFLVNPQVTLISLDGRFLSRSMGLFETASGALAAVRSAAGVEASAEPVFQGVFTYLDPVRRFHTADFVYRIQAHAGPAFFEPDETQRWILHESATGGDGNRLREHPALGTRVYPEPYYLHVRPHIGNDWFLGMAAGAFVMDGGGRILLQKRRDNGLWCNPGGCLEPGEKIAQAAIREVEEETGYLAGDAVLAGVFTGPECVITYASGDRLRFLDFIFTARIAGGEPRPVNEETVDLGWFDPRALPKGIMETSRRHVEKLLATRWRFVLD